MSDTVKAFTIDSGLYSLCPPPLFLAPALQHFFAPAIRYWRGQCGWLLLPFNYRHGKYNLLCTSESPPPSGGAAHCLNDSALLLPLRHFSRSISLSPRAPLRAPGLTNWLWEMAGWWRDVCMCETVRVSKDGCVCLRVSMCANVYA